MTVIELKEKLISQINSTENEGLLEEISRIIDFESSVEDIYMLSPDEADAVDDGLDQIKKGLFFSHEESNNRADEWLKKFDGR